MLLVIRPAHRRKKNFHKRKKTTSFNRVMVLSYMFMKSFISKKKKNFLCKSNVANCRNMFFFLYFILEVESNVENCRNLFLFFSYIGSSRVVLDMQLRLRHFTIIGFNYVVGTRAIMANEFLRTCKKIDTSEERMQ